MRGDGNVKCKKSSQTLSFSLLRMAHTVEFV